MVFPGLLIMGVGVSQGGDGVFFSICFLVIDSY